MYCTVCDNSLISCTCKDLEDRVKSLFDSPYLYFTPDQKEAIQKQASKNRDKNSLNE